MTRDDAILLAEFLREWRTLDHGNCPNFLRGNWDRRVLDALIEDVELAAGIVPK